VVRFLSTLIRPRIMPVGRIHTAGSESGSDDGLLHPRRGDEGGVIDDGHLAGRQRYLYIVDAVQRTQRKRQFVRASAGTACRSRKSYSFA
jgi:hypothetical protein